MKNELSNIYCILEDIKKEMYKQNVIEAQRNEIMKELAFQHGHRLDGSDVDLELIRLKIGDKL